MPNLSAVALRLSEAGYNENEINRAIAYAEAMNAADEDEALSLATAHILYDADQLSHGERYPVEPGSIDWNAYL